jgi:fructose-1,6-bisphosphatase/inositol monophosphatase family enzyme
MIRRQEHLLEQLRQIHTAIRDRVLAACEETSIERLGEVVADDAGDTIFAIDRVSEEALLDGFERLARDWSFVLVAEGLGGSGWTVLPRGTEPDRAELRIIIDPIDGTRGLIYQKRPAWILTGVAPNRGPRTTLADITLAVQTEIPLLKQHLSDTLWAAAGRGVGAERRNRLTGECAALVPTPSRAVDLVQGYGGVARFFPGGAAELAEIEDQVVQRAGAAAPAGRVMSFSDQYASTGGQLYELMMGHDRWIADLRAALETKLRPRRQTVGMCCHPYDLCTELIAREAGVSVTDEHGAPLAAPLEVDRGVSWIGYANAALRARLEPVLQGLLREHGLPCAEGT